MLWLVSIIPTPSERSWEDCCESEVSLRYRVQFCHKDVPYKLSPEENRNINTSITYNVM